MRLLLCLGLAILGPLGCGDGKDTDPTRTAWVDTAAQPDSGQGDSGAPPDTDEDCSDELAPEVDWLAPGPHPVGWQTHETTSMLRDVTLTRLFVAYYPAGAEGEAAMPNSTDGPFPVVFFEHAGGAHYLDYVTLFSHLVSHGVVVVSIDHTTFDGGWCSTIPCGWGSTDWWDAHDVLFQDTMNDVVGWSGVEGDFYWNLIDPDRMGLAGHSHGSALRTMQHLAPISTDAEHEIQAVALLAPCPDEAIGDYLHIYGDMPPLQVIYGSRDQDGCVAYGQSIAVFEAAQSPRHFVHLVGGSHYGFTDTGSLLDASISREDHQKVAAAGWLAWWKYQLEDDRSALPYLRGDRPLVPAGPEIMTQFLDADPLVIDDFTHDESATYEWVEVPVITGIEGQTYVNGFLSDAFVDPSAGTAVVRAEIESLLGASGAGSGPADVLFFLDHVLGLDAYGMALDELEVLGDVDAVRLGDHSEFAAQLALGGWDLVISATQTGSASDENASDAALADWICAGGRAIVSDYRMDSAGAAAVLACSLTAFDDPTNYETIHSDGDLFSDSLDLFNPGWGFYAVGLQTTGATVFAHTLVEGAVSTTLDTNTLGLPVESSGLSELEARWMLDGDNGLYHPSWGLAFSWETPGATLRQVLSTDGGLDITDTPVLSFRVLQVASDSLNPAGMDQDLHLRLTDARGRQATVLLSEAPQGALRPAPEVGAGTQTKSVYETYRLPLDLFTSSTPALDSTRLVSVEWVLDVTGTGALVMDDVHFTRAGLCE